MGIALDTHVLFPFSCSFLNVKGLHVLTEFPTKVLTNPDYSERVSDGITGMPERLQSYKQADIQSTEHLNIQINFLIALSRLQFFSRQLSETLYTDHRMKATLERSLSTASAPEGTTSQHT